MTTMERIFDILLANRNRYVSIVALSRKTGSCVEAIRKRVHDLRRLLPADHYEIHTARGLGYCLVVLAPVEHERAVVESEQNEIRVLAAIPDPLLAALRRAHPERA